MCNYLRSVAVVGSGIAGLTAGNLLARSGLEVLLFDKARGPGGRVASKRVERDTVDMGAQYFTVRNEHFRQFLAEMAGGSIDVWEGRLSHENGDGGFEPFPQESRWVAVPRMSSLARALAGPLDVRSATPVRAARPASNGWFLEMDSMTCGPFDGLVVTTPPEQARALLPGLASELDGFSMDPCWAVAARFSEPVETGFDGASLKDSILDWVARNTSKPGRKGRSPGEWWILHATPSWSREQLETAPDDVARLLVERFRQRFHIQSADVQRLAHRWRYARPAPDSPTPGCLSLYKRKLGFCGDWLQGGRVEGAFASADSLVSRWRDSGLIP